MQGFILEGEMENDMLAISCLAAENSLDQRLPETAIAVFRSQTGLTEVLKRPTVALVGQDVGIEEPVVIRSREGLIGEHAENARVVNQHFIGGFVHHLADAAGVFIKLDRYLGILQGYPTGFERLPG